MNGGLYFEEFEINARHRHAISKTVTDADNALFCALTYNPQPLHIDEHVARQSVHGGRIVNGIFVLGLILGVSVSDLTLGTLVANLSLTDVNFVHPVRIGDSIRSETIVLSKRESRSRPETGVVELETRGYNQDDTLVVSVRRTALMLRKV